ncbi:hypothetical protein BACOVA_04474 [Bacteroides ovatus ATCC 8483]|uniref:Uncharacterized protein n=1 Tax=Bacteroides ovatus (strain ATCC 8483 / DSM 1896 / JCM 5824 / BCRC 10623 / CCUG 4943 / NCTC 11153) TaxID=411476 RepID=A0AAN3A5A3_BACO1|nr:hypothetical protein BACOVA_04474 [Bacteroides ovatus ATCC 8483]
MCRTAYVCGLYGLHTWAVQPAYVGYKKTDILTGLLSCQIRIIIL